MEKEIIENNMIQFKTKRNKNINHNARYTKITQYNPIYNIII